MNFSKMVVGLVVVLLCLIVSLMFILQTPSSTNRADIAVCSQNANIDIAKGLTRGENDDVIFTCPVSQQKITKTDLTRDTSLVAKNQGISSIQYNYENLVWTQVKECYEKVNYGSSILLLSAFEQNAQIYGSTNMCVICADVTITKDALDEMKSLQNTGTLMDKKEIEGVTLKEKVLASSNTNLIFDSKVDFRKQEQNYVVYFRTTRDGWYSKFRNWFVAATGITSTFAEYFDETTTDPWKGYQSVAIVSSEEIAQNCDWIVNDYEEAK